MDRNTRKQLRKDIFIPPLTGEDREFLKRFKAGYRHRELREDIAELMPFLKAGAYQTVTEGLNCGKRMGVLNTKLSHNTGCLLLAEAIKQKLPLEPIKFLISEGACLTDQKHGSDLTDKMSEALSLAEKETVDFLIDECTWSWTNYAYESFLHQSAKQDRADIFDSLLFFPIPLQILKNVEEHLPNMYKEADKVFYALKECDYLISHGTTQDIMAKIIDEEEFETLKDLWAVMPQDYKKNLNFLSVENVVTKKHLFSTAIAAAGIEIPNHNRVVGQNAIHTKNVELLDTVLKRSDFNIHDEGVTLLEIAIVESPDCACRLYDAGCRLSLHKPLRRGILDHAAKGVVTSFLDDVANRPNCRDLTESLMDMMVDNPAEYPFLDSVVKLGFKKMPNEMHYYFKQSLKAENHGMTNLIIKNGLNLKGMSEDLLKTIGKKTSSYNFRKMIEHGLSEDDQQYILNQAKIYKNESLCKLIEQKETKEQITHYPRWEKQDDHTIAELSFVRQNDKNSYVRLRRAFNLQAGVVDSYLETCENRKVCNTIMSTPVSVNEFNEGYIAKARAELEKQGGSGVLNSVAPPRAISRLGLQKKPSN